MLYVKVTKNVSESSHSSNHEPNLTSDLPGGRGESGNAPNNMDGDSVDVDDEIEEAFDDVDDTEDDDIGMHLDSIDKDPLGERRDKGIYGQRHAKRYLRTLHIYSVDPEQPLYYVENSYTKSFFTQQEIYVPLM